MADQNFGMQSAGTYQQLIAGGVSVFSGIFGGLAANKSVDSLNINYDDVVVESTHVDSQQVIIGVAALVMLGFSIYLAIK